MFYCVLLIAAGVMAAISSLYSDNTCDSLQAMAISTLMFAVGTKQYWSADAIDD